MQKAITDLLIEKLAAGIPEEASARIAGIKINTLTESGYDEFGFNKEYLKASVPAAMFLYRKYFRAEAFGIQNIPEDGPAILIANHGGQIPVDGMLIVIACMLEMDKPRLVRSMIEKWIPTLPVASVLFTRIGQVVGIMENADKLLENGELMLIFPEGVRGLGKTWDSRYRLQRFTVGFMELAIRHKAPIIPVAVTGCEEQQPSFSDSKEFAEKIGFPYLPITPTFPWLGPLGLIPYPTKYRIYFGEPMDFSDREADLSSPALIKRHVLEVRNTIQSMINQGLKERPFPGF